MLKIVPSNQFKKDLKLAKKRGFFFISWYSASAFLVAALGVIRFTSNGRPLWLTELLRNMVIAVDMLSPRSENNSSADCFSSVSTRALSIKGMNMFYNVLQMR